MAQIICVCNQKGGVGKSTTAINLGAYLAEMGKFVLLVDLDPQANATLGLGVDYQNLEQGIYEVISGLAQLPDIIISSIHQNYHLAPATIALAGAGVELVNLEDREFKLAKALNGIAGGYDYIIIDCPPSLGLLTINGLVASDKVLIPVQSEFYALEGLGQLLNTVSLIQQNLKPDLDILGALITMYDRRYRLSQDVLEELYRYFPNKIFRSVIPRCVSLAEAPSHGKTILHYDPNSRAAKAYQRLAREIVVMF